MKKLKIILGMALLLTFSISCEKETVSIEDVSLDFQKKIRDYAPNNIPNEFIINIKSQEVNNKINSGKGGSEIVNGSFENGFTGWNIETNGEPLWPWQTNLAGVDHDYGFAVTEPQDGSYVIANAFDGAGPMSFVMYQDVYISCSVELSWKDRIQWDYTYGPFANPRTLDVQLRDPSDNSILADLYNFSTGSEDVNPTGDTGWQDHSIDLLGYVGFVRIYFIETIPENYTGPAQIEFDAIALSLLDDDDCDGILDKNDPHPDSNLSSELSFDGCYPGVSNQFSAPGTTMMDEVDDVIAGVWAMMNNPNKRRNFDPQRQFQSDMSNLINSWYRRYDALVTDAQKFEITKCVRRSRIFDVP